jgi:hypothetical protein
MHAMRQEKDGWVYMMTAVTLTVDADDPILGCFADIEWTRLLDKWARQLALADSARRGINLGSVEAQSIPGIFLPMLRVPIIHWSVNQTYGEIPRMTQTLQEYLENNLDRSHIADNDRPVIDHILRATRLADGTIEFYIHPHNVNGDTPVYVVSGNTVTPK